MFEGKAEVKDIGYRRSPGSSSEGSGMVKSLDNSYGRSDKE